MTTPIKEIPHIVEDLRRCYRKKERTLDDRKKQLRGVLRLIEENTSDFVTALKKDLNRHPSFTKKVLGGCVRATQLAIDNLSKWSQARVHDPVGENKAEVRMSPRGLVLIIGTWNFPCPLVLKPLVSAIAAGNCVVIKLSEISSNTSSLLAKLLGRYLDRDVVRVVQGAIPESTALLRCRFDLIFYTGNTNVGRIVMAAAARHLTPTVLELGGKNPAIVTKDANVAVAAKKIVDGRFKNAGQFCVAPDYVLCDESVLDEFLEGVQNAVTHFFGKNAQESESFGRIVSERHCKRLANLISDPKRGGKLLMGGDINISQRFVSPTVILNPSLESKLMKQEIFGPVLPVLSVKSADHAMEFVNDRHSPLALYVFSKSKSNCDSIVNGTRSGGVCVNDVIVHMLNETLPFGGFGESGMGNYHGWYGFRAFSHERAVMIVDSSHDDLSRYPPYKSAL